MGFPILSCSAVLLPSVNWTVTNNFTWRWAGTERYWNISLLHAQTELLHTWSFPLGWISSPCKPSCLAPGTFLAATFSFFSCSPDETRSSAWKGLPLRTLFGTIGLWPQLDPPAQATVKQMVIKQAGRSLCWAHPTLVYSHILRHYLKSRWCSVVEQTSNYPPDTPWGLPACDRKKLLHPKLRAVVWLFSIIGCNRV